jgi:hypothetical protein
MRYLRVSSTTHANTRRGLIYGLYWSRLVTLSVPKRNGGCSIGSNRHQLKDEAVVLSAITRPFTARGNVTRKIVPAPEVRSTVTVPPWS